MKEIVILSIAFLGVGCNPFAEFKPDSTDIVKSGWAKNKQRTPPNDLYCYKTLGDSVCYTHPLKDGESRLSGNFERMEGIPEDQTVWEEMKEAVKGMSSSTDEKIIRAF
ncbi:MAG: hypothetical protein NWS47_05020 [Alphaproteobacteria bacterium]|nr:hypothetical protein [Alphaproteobacteria bacterium]